MNYREFFEKTKLVELYPFSIEERINRTYNRTELENTLSHPVLNPVKGLYFPNEEQIMKLWKLTATDEQKKDLELTSEIYDLKLFIPSLHDTINAPYIASLITNPLNIVASRLHKSSPGTNSNSKNFQDLIDLIGDCYEQTGLLRNDIRIRALEQNNSMTPQIIVNFRPEAVGYVGMAFLHYDKIKK